MEADMDWLITVLRDFTPGAAGIWSLVVINVGYLVKVYIETSKLSAEERQARREGFASQVEYLTKENRTLRSDYDQYRILCQRETDQLRHDIIKLEYEIAGIRREAAGLALSMIRRGGRSVLISDELLETLREMGYDISSEETEHDGLTTTTTTTSSTVPTPTNPINSNPGGTNVQGS